MSVVTTNRKIDINAVGFGAIMRGDGTVYEIEADVPEVDLQAAVDAAPDDPTPVREANADAIDQAITNALAELRMMRDYAALPAVPSGTMTTAQLSNAMRTLRDEAQTNRQGIQRVCSTLIGTIRLLRGDFDDVA